jgi:hypothetical protein
MCAGEARGIFQDIFIKSSKLRERTFDEDASRLTIDHRYVMRRVRRVLCFVKLY